MIQFERNLRIIDIYEFELIFELMNVFSPPKPGMQIRKFYGLIRLNSSKCSRWNKDILEINTSKVSFNLVVDIA